MAEHDPNPGTPEWWRDRLYKQLREQTAANKIYDEYYEGEHRLAFATSNFRRIFGDLFSEFADNWCGLVVDAPEERLNVEGFRFGTDEERLQGDLAAWQIWQRNQMDAYSQQGHLESLIWGDASALVWQEDEKAIITVEHPSQMIVAHHAASVTRRQAALKAWTDDFTGETFATLYMPNFLYKWKRPNRETSGVLEPKDWERRIIRGEPWPLPNPLKVVPVVPLINRPRLLRPGQSEIKNVIPMQDAVNKLIADMMIASEYQSFRQRWATGIDIPILFDEEGEPLPDDQQQAAAWQHAIDRLWTSEDPETTFGEFDVTDLQSFVTGVEMMVQHIASQSKTPPHYFYLSGQFPSGESIKSAETGLVAKVLRKQRFYGEAWEEVMRIAFAVEGVDARADDVFAETIWSDAETRTESEHVDAVIKKRGVGIPLKQLWEDLGYTQAQIARFEQMLAEEAAQASDLAAGLARALDEAAVDPSLNGGPSDPADEDLDGVPA